LKRAPLSGSVPTMNRPSRSTTTLPALPDAAALLAASDAGRHLAPQLLAGAAAGADAPAPPDIDAGLRVQADVVALRLARGEVPLGYKIGFTNRAIWPLYNVRHPIWAPVWSTTVRDCADGRASIDVSRWSEPRLEPEIVFGLRTSPLPGDAADPARLVEAIEWIAHGFEIVQSVFPGWKFDASRAFAAQGLHAALIVGPRVPRAAFGPDPAAALAALRLSLSLDGRAHAEGRGSDVLDGPVQSLGHLVAELGRRGQRLASGAIVTTGTLTDAQPLRPGQRWRTQIDGAPLPGLELETTGG
jgi:2-keto-4-pentenoate hydratase